MMYHVGYNAEIETIVFYKTQQVTVGHIYLGESCCCRINVISYKMLKLLKI